MTDLAQQTIKPATNKTVLTFELRDDQAKIVNRAISAAKRQAGINEKNTALKVICSEWVEMHKQIDVLQALSVETAGLLRLGQIDEDQNSRSSDTQKKVKRGIARLVQITFRKIRQIRRSLRSSR